MRRKLFILMFVISILFIAVACDNTETTDETPTDPTNPTEPTELDIVAPTFKDVENGFVYSIEHLETENYDLLFGIDVSDDVTAKENITLEIVDFGDYSKDVPGLYTITIQAQDEANNAETVKRQVTVLERLAIETLKLEIDGEEQSVYANEKEALSYTSSGTKFRSKDAIQLMSKAFFIEEYNKYKNDHTNNASVPFMPNGALILVDTDMKIKLVRIASGISIEIDSENQLEEGSALDWNVTLDPENGGGIFKGIMDQIDSLLPDGGYLLFAAGKDPYVAREKLIRTVFNTTYTTGAINTAERNIDIREVNLEILQEFDYIAMPTRIPSPVINLRKNIVTWDQVTNASSYAISIDGVEQTKTTNTYFDLEELELALTPDGETGYDVTVQAISSDFLKYGSSNASNNVIYKKIVMSDLSAPTITKVEDSISWNPIQGAIAYDLYFTVGTTSVKADSTTTTAFDLSKYEDLFSGVSYVSIVAVGDFSHYDSLPSNTIQVTLGKVETLVIQGYKVDVMKTGALNYFMRRNLTYAAQNGFSGAPHLFLIVDASTLTEKHPNIEFKEAYSTIVLLENDYTVKMINSIGAGNSWNILDEWYQNPFYKSNQEQIESIIPSIYTDDMLLIGKNANRLSVITPDNKILQDINAREFVSHFYVKDNGVNFMDEAWRGEITTFLDPSAVKFTIEEKEIIETQKLQTPILAYDGTTLSWEIDENAEHYIIFANGINKLTTTDNYVNLSELNLPGSITGITYDIQVQAMPLDMLTYGASDKSLVFEYTQFGENEEPETFNTIRIGSNETSIAYNHTGVLNHTSSGAVFRSRDIIQVMTKEHFVSEFTQASTASGYAANGNVVFFPYGVLMVVDKELNVTFLRSGVGTLLEVDASNVLKTSNLGWSNSQTTAGSGVFANLVGTTLNTLIPDDGYVMFAPATSNNTARTFMIQNLLQSGYQSGGVITSSIDIDIRQVIIQLIDRG